MQSIRRPLAAATLLVSLLGASATSAAADAPPGGVAVQTDHRSPAAITRHWTPQRLRAARPAQVPAAGRATRARSRRQAPEGAPAKTEGSRSRLGRRGAPGTTGRPGDGPLARSSYFGLELPWTNTSYGTATPINAVGRLYYVAYSRSQNRWYDSYCSGTLVAPNIVLTAAHCVREGRPDGVKYHSFTFAPAVNGTSRPYGTFTSRNQATWTSWFSAPYYNSAGTDSGGGYYGQDYAFVVLDRDAWGRNAGDANMAGFYGLLANAPRSDVYHLGYPTEGTWNGCTRSSCRPWHCAAPLQRYSQYATGGKWDIGFSCYTTGGASGGPIFQAHNGRWYVTAALSHMGKVYCQNGANPCLAGSDRYGTTFFGSYLDNDTLALLSYAKTL